MSNARRSLGDALATKKAQEFIHGRAENVSDAGSKTVELKRESESRDSAVGETGEPRPKTTRRRKRRQTSESKSQPASTDLLVPLTTRVRQSTADAIERAYMEHRLKKLTPNTKQEIVEAALREWLAEHGFLDR